MEVKLVVQSGKSAGKSIVVKPPKFIIGRAEDCHLRPQSDLVSRHHCAVLIEDGLVTVRDLGSRNGTCVNGQTVGAEQELKVGDTLKVGPLEFAVQIEVQVGGKKKPKVKNVGEAAARTAAAAEKAAGEPEIEKLLSEADSVEMNFAETRTINTAVTQPSDTAEIGPVVQPEDYADEQRKKASAKDRRVGLAPSRKMTTDSSRDAAAAMLEKLLKRRH